MRGLATLTLLAALTACGGPPHVPLVDAQLRSSAPRNVAFDALYRRAGVLGYVYEVVDPQRAVFSVHSRVLGRPPRRRARPGPDPRAAERSNLFVVTVFDDHVEITAVGRDVEEGASCDPSLAQELEIFGESMQRTLASLGGGLLGGAGYGGAGYGGAPLPPADRSDPATPPTEPSAEPAGDGPASGLSTP